MQYVLLKINLDIDVDQLTNLKRDIHSHCWINNIGIDISMKDKICAEEKISSISQYIITGAPG